MIEGTSFKEKVENYCKDRKKSTDNQDIIYLGEVDDLCPLCGRPLIYSGDRRVGKNYEIAHIFPCNPTNDDLTQLDGVELLGNNAESMDNKIALCKLCHNDYDKNKTREKYDSLANLKKKTQTQYKVKTEISKYEIEEELIATIKKIGQLSASDLAEIELDYNPKKICEKVRNLILRNDIENNVRTYFGFINRHIEIQCRETNADMNSVSLSVKSSYYKCKQKGLDQEAIFSTLANWVHSKTMCSTTSARIIISYFVQTCDVYEKLSK